MRVTFAWKAIPSEARVTRDEVSGLKPRRGGLSGRQYLIDKLFRLRLSRRVQNLSRITRMRRICSFHGFFYLDYFFIWICMRLSGAGIFTDLPQSVDYLRTSLAIGNPAPYRRKYNPKYIQDQVNLRIKKIREKIKSVASELSVSYFERVRTEPKAKEQSTNS